MPTQQKLVVQLRQRCISSTHGMKSEAPINEFAEETEKPYFTYKVASNVMLNGAKSANKIQHTFQNRLLNCCNQMELQELPQLYCCYCFRQFQTYWVVVYNQTWTEAEKQKRRSSGEIFFCSTVKDPCISFTYMQQVFCLVTSVKRCVVGTTSVLS